MRSSVDRRGALSIILAADGNEIANCNFCAQCNPERALRRAQASPIALGTSSERLGAHKTWKPGPGPNRTR
jgi:hypothetical protein